MHAINQFCRTSLRNFRLCATKVGFASWHQVLACAALPSISPLPDLRLKPMKYPTTIARQPLHSAPQPIFPIARAVSVGSQPLELPCSTPSIRKSDPARCASNKHPEQDLIQGTVITAKYLVTKSAMHNPQHNGVHGTGGLYQPQKSLRRSDDCLLPRHRSESLTLHQNSPSMPEARRDLDQRRPSAAELLREQPCWAVKGRLG